MKKKHTKRFSLFNQNGNSVVMATIVMALVSVSGISMLKMSTGEQVQTGMDVTKHKANYLAHAGIVQGMEKLYNGTSPDRAKTDVYDGAFEVVSDATARTITATGYAGDARVTQTVSATFAADCFEINFSSSNYDINIGPHEWSKLYAVKARKNCTDIGQVQVDEIRVLYGAPISSKMVKHIDINGSDFVYHVPDATVGYEYPSGAPEGTPISGAKSKDLIDIDAYTFSDTAYKDMTFFWNTSFSGTGARVEVIFSDGSIYTSPVRVL